MSVLEHGNGTYEQERVYILATLERLEEEKKIDAEKIAGQAARLTKAGLDLNEAHNRIRELKTDAGKLTRHVLKLEIRAGYIATVAGSIVAILAELVKHWWK